MVRLVGINERGLRIGEDHQRAKLTDRDIELFWQLREQGLGCKRLAAKLDISHQHAKRLLKGTQRSQRAVNFKKVTT